MIGKARRRLAANAGQPCKTLDQARDRPSLSVHETTALLHPGHARQIGHGDGACDLLELVCSRFLNRGNGLVDGRCNEVLQRLNVVGVDDIGIEFEFLDLLFPRS